MEGAKPVTAPNTEKHMASSTSARPSLSGRVLRNSFIRMTQFVLGISLSFFMMPWLVRHLGDRMYGLWTLVGSVLGYYGLIDVGLSSAVVRFISRAVGQDDKDEIRRVFCTAFYLFLTLGLMTAGLTFGIAAFVKALVRNADDVVLFRSLLIILGLNFAFDFPVRAFNAVFTSTIRDDLSVGLSMIKTLLSTFFVVWMIAHGHGIVAMAAVSVTFSVMDSLARVRIAFLLEPAISIRPRYFDRTRIRSLFGYSAYTFVGHIADLFCYKMDSLVTTLGVGLAAVTHFAVASRLVEYMTQSLSEMIRVVTPVFSQDEGRNDFHAIRRRFSFLMRLSVFFAVFTCGVAAFYGRHFLDTWMGPAYRDSYIVLLILIGGLFIRLMQFPAIPVLYGISKHKYYTYTNLIEGSVNLVLSLMWVERWGIRGVALGTAVPMAFISIFVQPWYVCRVLSIPLVHYVRRLINDAGRAALCLAVGLVPGYFIARDSYASLVLCLVLQIATYWPLVFLLGFSPEEKRNLTDTARHALPARFRPAPAVVYPAPRSEPMKQGRLLATSAKER